MLAPLLISQTNLELPEQVYPAGFLDCVCVCVCVRRCAGSCVFRQDDMKICTIYKVFEPFWPPFAVLTILNCSVLEISDGFLG